MRVNLTWMAKKLIGKRDNKSQHWVGDGFPVRTLFSYFQRARDISPFLLLDYAGPHTFEPSDEARGVESHPHRGIETVTLVYQGEVEHRDSSGGGGRIGPGEVQWMTAASGVRHEENHGVEFTRAGGTFESIQLWVNLRAVDKKAAPAYQALSRESIPVVKGQGFMARVIAGELRGVRGPARTFTPIELWEVFIEGGATICLDLPAGHTCLVLVRNGGLTLGTEEKLAPFEVGIFGTAETELDLTTIGDTNVLIMAGEPIEEAVVGYGPFVMNTREEIRQAIQDYSGEQEGGDLS